jgi:hypothetical protein
MPHLYLGHQNATLALTHALILSLKEFGEFIGCETDASIKSTCATCTTAPSPTPCNWLGRFAATP